MRFLLSVMFLIPQIVFAQEIVCCNTPPTTLGCYELRSGVHTIEYTQAADGSLIKTIRGEVNGIQTFCECSYPYTSCGLDINPKNLRLSDEGE